MISNGWVIIKSSRTYDGGLGYTGPSWGAAGLPVPTKPFDTLDEAHAARMVLDEVNEVGWAIRPYHADPEPEPDPLTTHESTKRVLFHLVAAYQVWRAPNSGLGIPNEFTDDAVRIGEQHLRDVDWFPENEGWLANNTDTSPNDGTKISADNVLALIDVELSRLKDDRPGSFKRPPRWNRRARGWLDGIHDTRYVAARKLQTIRDAYVVESTIRKSEALRLYGVPEEDIDAW